jgi:hypothetical protein
MLLWIVCAHSPEAILAMSLERASRTPYCLDTERQWNIPQGLGSNLWRLKGLREHSASIPTVMFSIGTSANSDVRRCPASLLPAPWGSSSTGDSGWQVLPYWRKSNYVSACGNRPFAREMTHVDAAMCACQIWLYKIITDSSCLKFNTHM